MGREEGVAGWRREEMGAQVSQVTRLGRPVTDKATKAITHPPTTLPPPAQKEGPPVEAALVPLPVPVEEEELELPHAPAHHGHLLQLGLEDDLEPAVQAQGPRKLPAVPPVGIDLLGVLLSNGSCGWAGRMEVESNIRCI